MLEQKAKYKIEIRELEAKLCHLDKGIKEAEQRLIGLVSVKTFPCTIPDCTNIRKEGSYFCEDHLSKLNKKVDVKA